MKNYVHKVFFFCSPNKLAVTDYVQIKACNVYLEKIPYFKYLSITIDSELNFTEHIDVIHDKGVKKQNLLAKTWWLFDAHTTILLYNSLILSLFDYCDTIYGIAPQTEIARLQKVQNSAGRIILKADPCISRVEIHVQLNFDMLSTQRD